MYFFLFTEDEREAVFHVCERLENPKVPHLLYAIILFYKFIAR